MIKARIAVKIISQTNEGLVDQIACYQLNDPMRDILLSFRRIHDLQNGKAF